MIRLRSTSWISISLLLLLITVESCKKDDNNPPSAASCTDGIQNGQEVGIDCGGPDCSPCAAQGSPTVVTLPMDEINPFSARAKGQIIDEGDSALISRGFVFSASSNPDTSDFIVGVSGTPARPGRCASTSTATPPSRRPNGFLATAAGRRKRAGRRRQRRFLRRLCRHRLRRTIRRSRWP